MAFASLEFLGWFAAIAIVYYLLPHRFRWILLLLASLYFYSTFKLGYVALLLGFTLLVYLVSFAMPPREGRKRTLPLTLALVGAFIPLLVFKYYNFFLGSLDTVLVSWLDMTAPSTPRLDWLLPAGLSFFTFSCVSYLMDIYRGKLPVEKNLGRMATYVAFFPKLLMGPIDRATTFLPQLMKPVKFNGEDTVLGMQMILWGLFKKAVIADRLGAFVFPVFQNVGQASTVDLVLGSYLFCFQIYCDFSGYTDMATGLARVLGIKIMVNFRRPYFSTSISEFWGQRWHVSLTRWMRDYLYIPLGGSRVPTWRRYLNTYIVFAVSGLWHGAAWGYVFWGIIHGTWMALAMATHGVWTWLGKLLRVPGKVATVLGGLAVWHMHMIGAMFFVVALLGGGFKQAGELFSRVGKEFTHIPSLLVNRDYSREFLSYFVLLAALIVVEVMEERWNLWEKLRVRPVYVRWAVYYAVALVVIGLGIWRPASFIYQSF